MKTLYLECKMGAAGDMLTAALLELIPDADDFIRELNQLSIPGIFVSREKVMKCGIQGSHVSVLTKGVEEDEIVNTVRISEMQEAGAYTGHACEHVHESSHEHMHEGENGHAHEYSHEREHSHEHEGSHEHEHSHDQHSHNHQHFNLEHIRKIVEVMPVSDKVKTDILAVYHMIGEAESFAHGRPVEHIHFHEVGSMDAIMDVTAVCLLMEKIAPENTVISPVNIGGGMVKCAHGILPVPAPATAHILKGLPIYGGEIQTELCTPTGAALLKYFGNSFGPMPLMCVEKIGYGMGKKEFKAANCLRAFLGEAKEKGV